ncbi:MAG: DNA-binding protein [Devosia sp.]|nr:DNA-binding protein [Devosia sp.]MBN9333270.1 DNA-binding protein [Devosia sp.]
MDLIVRETQDHVPLDLVWGAAAIARVIGRSTKATYHMLEAGNLPARQVGRRWVASRKILEAFIETPDGR